MGRIDQRRVPLRDGRSCRLRVPEPADAAALIDHVRALLADGAGQVGLPEELALTPEQEREWIRAHAETPGWIAILAEVEGVLAGLLNFESGPRRRLAHRGGLGMGVRRELRGLGVGRAVRADNEPAIALYRALGFEQEGRRAREIKLSDGEHVDDLLMARFVAR